MGIFNLFKKKKAQNNADTGVFAPPRTYSEWVDIFEHLKERYYDDDLLAAMQNGTIEWQIGVAERFTSKLTEAVNYRMNAATDKFQKDMNRSGGSERETVGALLALRKEFSFLAKVMQIKAIPESDRHEYLNLVTAQADAVQKSLEDSAKKEHTGKLLSIVKNNKVNAFNKEP